MRRSVAKLTEALLLVRQGAEVADRGTQAEHNGRVWAALAEVTRAAGRTAEADDAVATAVALYERKGNVAAAARLGQSTGRRPADPPVLISSYIRIIGAGEGPCVIVMTGSRAVGFEVVYPVNEVAAKYGASVLEETSKPADA